MKANGDAKFCSAIIHTGRIIFPTIYRSPECVVSGVAQVSCGCGLLRWDNRIEMCKMVCVIVCEESEKRLFQSIA
jgi:hypothetical protein